jgi:hypothetical protein
MQAPSSLPFKLAFSCKQAALASLRETFFAPSAKDTEETAIEATAKIANKFFIAIFCFNTRVLL